MNFDRTFYVCASLSATCIKNQAACVAQIGRTDFDTLLILQHLIGVPYKSHRWRRFQRTPNDSVVLSP